MTFDFEVQHLTCVGIVGGVAGYPYITVNECIIPIREEE